MTLGPLLLLASCLALSACAGRSEGVIPASSDAGSSTVGGFPSSAGALRPPVPITESPKILGASPVKCSGTPAPDPALVRACVLAASCSLFPQPNSVSDCIAKALPGSGALPKCVIGAQSCVEMDACLGNGLYSDACAADDTGPTCIGTKVVHCESIPRYYNDCAKQGAFCVEYSSRGDDVSDSADCAVKATCGASRDVYVCDGTKRVHCRKGIGFGEDCGTYGLKCIETPDGAVCAQDPPDCNQPGSGICNKSGIGTYCDFDGRTLTLDCPRLGFICQETPKLNHGIQCMAPACSLEDAGQCFEECDGPMAHLCIGGQRFSINCDSYGLQNCVLETRPDTGDRARCGYR